MPSSVRQYWRDLQGRTSLNFNWDAINHDSVVAVTASEFNPDPNDPSHSPRFVGDATITVENVSPHGPPFDGNHGVTFVVNVDWGAPLNVVTDITVLDAPPVDIEYQKSILSFVMPTQLQSQWCWAATSLGVAQYYDPATTWTQCTIANSQLSRSDCCGVGAAGACNVGQVLDNPLQIVGHLDRMVLSVTAFADVATEVNSGRPHCIRITWSGGGAHFIAAIGYIGSDPATGQFLSVDDPIWGPSDVAYPTLQTSYRSTGKLGTQLLHEGLGPLMAPELEEPPPEAHRVASDAVGWLGRHGGLAARLPADVSVDDLELTKPHEELSLGLDDLTAGRGLGAAQPNGWHYLVAPGGAPLALAVTVTSPGGETRFTQLDYGPFVKGTSDALATAAALPGTVASHERVLAVPALGFVAAWVDQPDGTSLLVPVSPAPTGVEAGRAYPADELLAVLRRLAAERSAADGGVGA